jgi:hypothetical protein
MDYTKAINLDDDIRRKEEAKKKKKAKKISYRANKPIKEYEE